MTLQREDGSGISPRCEGGEGLHNQKKSFSILQQELSLDSILDQVNGPALLEEGAMGHPLDLTIVPFNDHLLSLMHA